MLTPAFAVIALIRIACSIPVLRWPLAGGLLAVLADLADLLLLNLLDPYAFGAYQGWDKWVDQVYLAAFLAVALRWDGAERAIAVALYVFRLVGFIAFELTGERALLIAFPNVFELWFLAVALAHVRGTRVDRTPFRIAAVLVVALALKLGQEWALHGARLFDEINAFEFLEGVSRLVTGG